MISDCTYSWKYLSTGKRIASLPVLMLEKYYTSQRVCQFRYIKIPENRRIRLFFLWLFPIYTKLAVLLLYSTVLIFFLKLFCWEFLMFHRKSLWTRELGQKCWKIFLFHLDHMLLWKIRLIRTELALLTLKDVSSSTIQKETTRANYSQRKWGPRRAKIGFQSGSSASLSWLHVPSQHFYLS